jgi:alkylation response protein AidB-like acyl-CoA dehydrogenase
VHFGFDEDQLAFRDAAAALFDGRAGADALKRAWADPSEGSMWETWADLARVGVQGLLAPATAGGAGADWVTLCLILAEAGRVALPLPLIETAAVGVPLLALSAGQEAVLGELAGGAVLTAAAGPGAPSPAAGRADWFLLGDDAPRLYRRDEVRITALRSVDATRDIADVEPAGTGAALGLPTGAPSVVDCGALGAAAELVGLGRALVSMTVDYVKDRRQFGVPVGSFQAVKHHLADAALHVEFAAPAVWAAAYHMSRREESPESAAELRRAVSLAKALASDAAGLAARHALQCHGAMGYAYEYHLHMWLKRVWCLIPAYGSPGWHRRRIGAELELTRGGT